MKTRMLLLGITLGYFITRKRWSVVHNCVVHPLYVVAEKAQWLDDLHEWTGKKWRKE